MRAGRGGVALFRSFPSLLLRAKAGEADSRDPAGRQSRATSSLWPCPRWVALGTCLSLSDPQCLPV